MAEYDDVKWESDDGHSDHDHEIKAVDEPLVVRGKKKPPPAPKKAKINFQADDYEICLLRHQLDVEKYTKEFILRIGAFSSSELIASELVVLLPASLALLSQQSEKNLSDVNDAMEWFWSTFKLNNKEVVVIDKKRKYRHPLQQVIDNKAGTALELGDLFLHLLNALQFITRCVSTIDPQSYSPQDHDDICQARKEYQSKRDSATSSSDQPINLIDDEKDSSKSSKNKKRLEPMRWLEVLVSAPDNAGTHQSFDAASVDSKEKPKSKGKTKGSSSSSSSSSSMLSRAIVRWVHVDIIRKVVDQPEKVEALRSIPRLDYVLAVEIPTGHLVDVTVRYKYNYPHMRVQDKHSQEYMSNWLKNFIEAHNERCDRGEVHGVIDLSEDSTDNPGSNSSNSSSSRNKANKKSSVAQVDGALRHKLAHHRELETRELEQLQERKLSVLPQSYKDFKDHPVYLLERHLLSDQVLHPTDKKVVAQFKGENVYLQRHKEKCRSFIQWRREARLVRRGEEPAKIITRLKMPGRNNKGGGKKGLRDEDDEEAGMDGGYAFELDGVDDGSKTVDIKLYGHWQTDPLCADRLVDGKIPVNQFGNIEVWDGKDVFVPVGAVFLEGSSAIKAAKNLNVHHVAALTGFEARKGGKFNIPVLGGVVVLKQDEQLVREAAAQLEAEAEGKMIEKREKLIAEKWKKLVLGALGRQQLRDKYGH